MKTLHAILIGLFSFLLAGCIVRGKPKVEIPPAPAPVAAPAPAPPPQPLSMPQTEVQLPPAQPVNPDALVLAPPPEAPAGTPPPSRPPVRTKPRQPAAAPPVEIEPPAAVTEPERPPVHEILAPAESAQLKNSADVHKREIRNWLNKGAGRRLSANNSTVARIMALLTASDEAEQKGDIREAADLADRALLFMRELQK